jgi:beta-glucosidase
MKNRYALSLVLAAILATPFRQSPAANDPLPPALVPVPQRGEWWMARHGQKLREIAEKGASIDLVFIGDSITQGLERPGSAKIVAEAFPGKTILNLGYNADKTENVLWRLRNGEIDGLSPEAVILMIGTNNAAHRRESPQVTSKAIDRIIGDLRAQLPKSKIILLSIFPRTDGPSLTLQQINQQTNALLPSLSDGKTIFHLDLNQVFLDANGQVPEEILPDQLHPSDKGNGLWIQVLKNRLDQILASP